MVFHEACDRLQRIDERLFYSNLEGFLIHLRIFKKPVINYVRHYISLKVVPIILYTIYVWFFGTIYTLYIFNTILNNRLVVVYISSSAIN